MSYHDPNTIITTGGMARKGRIINDNEHMTVTRGEMQMTFAVREKRGTKLYAMDHDDDEGVDYETMSNAMLSRALSTPENTSAMEHRRVRFPREGK